MSGVRDMHNAKIKKMIQQASKISEVTGLVNDEIQVDKRLCLSFFIAD